MAQGYLRTGEFAALCGVTKHTLFHYDDIGLLQPVLVDAKGYRYYSVHQAMTFDIIRILRSMGMALEDIKAYLQNRDVHAFLSVLTETDRQIEKEIARLNRLRASLRQTLAVTEESFHVPIGEIQWRERDATTFIITAAPSCPDAKGMAKAMGEHIAYCRSVYGYHSFTGGEIVLPDQMADGTFRAAYYSTEITGQPVGPQLYHKSAGTYAVQYVRCSYEALPAYYAAFLQQIRALGREAVGALYQEDVRNYLVERDYRQYVMKLEVAVKKAAPTGKIDGETL